MLEWRAVMPEKPHRSWNVDLGRLTLSGWLLTLVMLAAAVGGALATAPFLTLMIPEVSPKRSRWLFLIRCAVIAAPAVLAGGCVFLVGRQLLKVIGVRVVRGERLNGEDKKNLLPGIGISAVEEDRPPPEPVRDDEAASWRRIGIGVVVGIVLLVLFGLISSWLRDTK
jgi:hypothetical protein